MSKNSSKGKSIIVDLSQKSLHWDFDRWGNGKNSGDLLKGQYRFKFQDNSVRFEKKSGDIWVNLGSDYYKNIQITETGGLKIGNSVFVIAKVFGI